MIEEPIAIAVDWTLVNIHTVIHIGMTVGVAFFMAAVMIWIPYAYLNISDAHIGILVTCMLVTILALAREFRQGPVRMRYSAGQKGLSDVERGAIVHEDLARKQRALKRFQDDMEGGG